jgi:hypothetical protein
LWTLKKPEPYGLKGSTLMTLAVVAAIIWCGGNYPYYGCSGSTGQGPRDRKGDEIAEFTDAAMTCPKYAAEHKHLACVP